MSVRNCLTRFVTTTKSDSPVDLTRRRVLLAAGLAAILPVIPSSGVASTNSLTRVVFVNPGKAGEVFWDMVTATMQAAADDLGLQLEVRYSDRSRATMIKHVQSVINSPAEVDYLVMVNEEQSAGALIPDLDKAGVNTLLLLNDVVGEQRQVLGSPRSKYRKWLGSVTPDNEAAGYRMAAAIIDRATPSSDGKIHMLALAGDKLTPASIDRNAGMLRAVNERDDVILDRLLYANWSEQKSLELTTRYLEWAKRSGIRVGAVWAANDPIALGALEGLRNSKLKPGEDVHVAGLNWSAEGLDAVTSGDMVLTDGGHFLAGAWSMVLVYDHLRGADFLSDGPRVRFQMASIDRSNIDQYVETFGDQDWSLLNFRAFTRTDSPDSTGSYDFSLGRLLDASSVSEKRVVNSQ